MKTKQTKKLSNAYDEVKSYFNSEEKVSVNYITNSDNEDDDNTDDDNESDKSSDEDLQGVKEDTTCSRIAKRESLTLVETSLKKKCKLVLRWLPNSDNESHIISLRC